MNCTDNRLRPEGVSSVPKADGGEVLVSVVIPCRNEAAHIGSCLKSILAWPDAGADIEVIVVDGRSTDRTREIVEVSAASEPRIRLVDNPKLSSVAALNAGVATARGRWILRADAHSEYPADHLAACLRAAQTTGADNVGGVCVPLTSDDSVSAQVVRAVTTHRFGVGDAGFRTSRKAGFVDTVVFGFYSRHVIKALGGWDERFQEGSGDYEFNQRLRHLGGRIWLDPDIKVSYYNQPHFFRFLFKVFTRDGPANVLMWRLSPYAFRSRHAAPFVMIMAGILLGVLSLFHLGVHLGLMAACACYGVLAIAAAFSQAFRFRKPWMVLVLPGAFLLYHVVYGAGTIYGLCRLKQTNRSAHRALHDLPEMLQAQAACTPTLGLISIIIPCRNEARFIERCLRSVIAMRTCGYATEILVVDGESTDGTREIVEDLQKIDTRIRLVPNPLGITAAALNIGLRHAAGEWIVRLDAHGWYEVDYLEACLRVAERTGAAGVGGICIPELATGNLGARLVRAVTTHRFGVGRSVFRTGVEETPADTVLFGCYRREVFQTVGTWDERLVAGNEDYELNRRLSNAGYRLWFSPSIRAHYFNKASVGEFLRKVFRRDGPCNPWMWYLWPSAFQGRHVLPMCLVAGVAILAMSALWTAVPLSTLAIVYFVLAVVASVQQGLRYRDWMVGLLGPIVFFCYHMAYGLGGWYGIALLALGKAPVSPGRVRRMIKDVAPI